MVNGYDQAMVAPSPSRPSWFKAMGLIAFVKCVRGGGYNRKMLVWTVVQTLKPQG